MKCTEANTGDGDSEMVSAALAALASRDSELSSSWKRTPLEPHFRTLPAAMEDSAGDVGLRGEESRGSADWPLPAPPPDRGDSAAKDRLLTRTSSRGSCHAPSPAAWKWGVARVHHPDDLRGPARSAIKDPLLLVFTGSVGWGRGGAWKFENTCPTSSSDARLPAAHPVSRSLDGGVATPVREEPSEFDRDMFRFPNQTDRSMNESPWSPVLRREDARR